MPLPDGIQRADILFAIEAIDSSLDHSFADSTVYDVLHEGRRYPPKAVIGLAAEVRFGRPFSPADFSGGLGSKCFRLLEENGFEIVLKAGEASSQHTLAPRSGDVFEIGAEYHRRKDIHERFGGQRQGGMSTPKAYPFIFLFTGSAGEKHGYEDRFGPDGIYWFTGEGQRGDMTFDRSNRALRDHMEEGRRVFLFEATRRRGYVAFVNEAVCAGYRIEERPDTDDVKRDAIIFELLLGESIAPPENNPSLHARDSANSTDLRKASLDELRRLAMSSSSNYDNTIERIARVRMRSEAIRRYALKRANGICEGCKQPAPFFTRDGRPYLEVHHTTRLADGGPDHPEHVIAVCPTCHRRAHHGEDSENLNKQLRSIVQAIESIAH